MTEADEIVYVVDDDPAVRKGLVRLLRSAGHEVMAFASAMEFLARDHHQGVRCILLDVRMPGVGGLELQANLAAQGVDLPIVFLTGHGDIPMSVEAMKQGAADFLTKPVDEEVLLNAVRQALLRHRSFQTESQEAYAVRARVRSLTDRELEVLRWVIGGARNKQIAVHLGIAEQTVKIHRGRVMKKLGLSTATDLVKACQQAGIEPLTGL